ncbi:MAG: hypothetical protein IH587_05455 [Anaerolineae bacterium]|nr:hypothetical protein [Anaerolineae bacterium]
MKLEQRVQSLEQELALLKGQIQATLLDIQEQMLKRSYPSLQADDEAPDSSPARDAQSIKVMTARTAPAEHPESHFAGSPPGVQSAAAPVVRQISANAPYEPEDDFEEPVYAPPIRRAANNGSGARPVPPPAYQAPETEREIIEPPQASVLRARPTPTDRDWIELEKWVAHKVEQLGVARTQELIDFYAEQARFTEDERDMLLEFASLYDDNTEHAIDTDDDPETKKTPSAVSMKQPNIVPRTREVVDEIRAELRQREVISSAPQAQQPTTDQINDSQLLVLRLIAGILDAGENEAEGRQTQVRNGRRRG